MIPSDADGISGSEIGQIGSSIGGKIARTGQCREQEGLVTQTRRAAMLGQLLVMQRDNDRFQNPADFCAVHFANSRRASRRFRMNFRAWVICSSNSGS